jgi:hypothetical protein
MAEYREPKVAQPELQKGMTRITVETNPGGPVQCDSVSTDLWGMPDHLMGDLLRTLVEEARKGVAAAERFREVEKDGAEEVT